MFSKFVNTVKQKQPIAEVGIPRHIMFWATSMFSEYTYKNPKLSEVELQDPSKITIYCIHGTGDMPSAFSLIADRLLPNLPKEIAKIRLMDFSKRFTGKSIEDFAMQLKDRMLANNDKQVIVMGHSRGGLIAAYFAENLAAENNINVHAVVAISSPFKGSTLALPPLTWISRSVDEMKPNSKFLADLTQKIISSRNSYYYFAAKNDGIVAPQDCCIEAQKEKLQELDREHGHLSILSSHQLITYLDDIMVKSVSHMNSSTNEAVLTLRQS
jgi:pimeloyl-ACP methyl ester carboxylesterase